ncbi:hypothetical protein ACFFRR_000457 [Megaselia abdita]
MKPKINKELLPIKGHYFLFSAGTAPVVPFMPVLARQLGFSSVVVGTIYSILPLIGLLAKPLIGFLADKLQKHKLLFILAQGLTAVAFFCIMFIPSIATTVDFHCHHGEAILNICPSNTDDCQQNTLNAILENKTLTCTMKCQTTESQWDYVCKNWLGGKGCSQKEPFIEIKSQIKKISEIEPTNKCLHFHIEHDKAEHQGESVVLQCPDKDIYKSKCEVECDDPFVNELLRDSSFIPNDEVTGLYQFWLFFVCLIFSWAGMAVVVSVGDSICFDLLGEKHHLYGQQRLWGAVGFGITSLLAGVLVDAISGHSVIKDYSIIFWMTAVILGLDMLVSKKLPASKAQLSSNILKDISKMFLSPRITVFFIWCIFIGLCTALVWNFLLWHLEVLGNNIQGCNGQNSMKTLQGLAMGIQCFGGELPFLFLSGWLLQKIGHVNAMSLVLGAFGVRLLLYSFLVNPWYVLPIELLNGLTFGIFYSTMASYASIVAPPGTEATMQGLVGAIFEGVGVSIGSFVGGLLFESIGGSETFRIYGIVALVACLVHIIVQLLLQKYSKDKTGKLKPKAQFVESFCEEIENNKDCS